MAETTATRSTGAPTPFRVDVPDARLAEIRERVARYRHFPAPVDEGDAWRYGINSRWLKRLCDHWLDGFDWRAAEAELNRYPQYRVEIDGIGIHYVEIRGEGARRRPLLLLHGWPGSHFEFWKIAERLAFPSRHGGSAEDAFDLVIPSLPGYGFSGPAPRPIGMRTAARLLDTLMVETLGHARYMVQGGDWGAVVAAWLGADHAASCAAVHVNLIGLRPAPGDDGAASEEERVAIRAMMDRERPELAYAVQQSTRPQTLAIGLMDSPVGTAAWILDKFHDWSDLNGGSIEDVYTLDELLTNVMIYLVTDTICTSLWSYRGMAEERVPFDQVYCASPTAVAHYPYERVGGTPPRSWVERYYNVVRWTDLDRGGHFAALEQPDSLLEDVTAFARDAFPAGA
jgi:microsomal epoxide hydrolase